MEGLSAGAIEFSALGYYDYDKGSATNNTGRQHDIGGPGEPFFDKHFVVGSCGTCKHEQLGSENKQCQDCWHDQWEPKEEAVTPPSLKVGDRVVGRHGRGSVFYIGKTGRLLVEHDKEFPIGHNGSGNSNVICANNRGWFYSAEDLRPELQPLPGPKPPAFTPGQTVTGEDIKRALEAGWVLKHPMDSSMERWVDSNGKFHSNGVYSTLESFYCSNSNGTYTLLRKQDEPRPWSVPWNPEKYHPNLSAGYTPLKGTGRVPDKTGWVQLEPEKFKDWRWYSGYGTTPVSPPKPMTAEHLKELMKWMKDTPGIIGGHTPESLEDLKSMYLHPNRYPDLTINGKGAKMTKPITDQEKAACAKAIADAIEADVKQKAASYARGFDEWKAAETSARAHRKEADRLKELLGITPDVVKQFFGE